MAVGYTSPAMHSSAGPRIKGWIAASLCALLLVASALLSALAVHGKSATYDEPADIVTAWEALYHGDYRLEGTHPVLWKYLAALPLGTNCFTSDFASSEQTGGNFMDDLNSFGVRMLYGESDHRADRILFHARLMMLMFELALGAVLAIWAWQLAGPMAAVAATLVFALDPNFLAHAPLVKNDVAAAFSFCVAAYMLWLIGRRVTALRLMAMGVVLGVAVCIKLSTLLLGPIVLLALLIRALAWAPWDAWRISVKRRIDKLALAAAQCVVWSVMAAVVIWGCYRFRFAVSPDSKVPSQMTRFVELAPHPTPLAIRLALFARSRRFLPEGWLTDIVALRVTTTQHENFLMGQSSTGGWWYYFPLAFLFKTPLATLAAFVLAVPVLIKSAVRSRTSFDGWWTIVCVAAPVVIYGIVAVRGSFDIGLRHIFPIYPFLFLATGVAFGKWWAQRPRAAVWIGAALALGLAAESLAAFPNFIPFFNLAAGGVRGGLDLLSDSNIDWGQDLPLLAEWQRHHEQTPLYLCYFGTAPPAYYGIHYINLAGSYAPDTPGSEAFREGKPLIPGVIAISATQLQGTYLPPALREGYRPLQDQTPIAVLGGSIYLYAIE
jgi:hypothetical protein